MRLGDLDALKEKVNAFYDSLFVGCVSSDLIAYASGVDSIIDNAPTVCGNNPKWCESCVSKGKCASTRPQGDLISRSELKAFIKKYYKQTSQIKSLLSFIDTQKGGAE